MFKQTNTNNTNDPRPGRKAGHERPTRSTSEKKHARHGDTSRDHAYKAFASSTACRRQRQCNFPSSRHALGDRCCCGSRNRPWHACVCVCVSCCVVSFCDVRQCACLVACTAWRESADKPAHKCSVFLLVPKLFAFSKWFPLVGRPISFVSM